MQIVKGAQEHGCPWEAGIEGSSKGCCAQADEGVRLV
jgi:hypothetical protein